MFRLTFLTILFTFSIFSIFGQISLTVPLSKDKLVTVENDLQNYSIKLIDLEKVVFAEKTLGSIDELVIRSIQYVGNNTFFVDGKKKGFRVKVEGNNLSILEKREVPFEINGLNNYFYFFTPEKEIHVRYLNNNTVKVSIYNKDNELIFSDYASYTVKTNKNEEGEFPRLIFQPNNQILTLSSNFNNIWHSIDLNQSNFTQRAYGILPSGKKGMLYRMFDPISNSQYQIVSDDNTYEVYKVSNFNSVIPLKDNQFLLGTVDKFPLFVIDNCVYFSTSDAKGFEKKCF
jgi:hypothetical protein